MQYRTDRAGNRLSILGFGCMRFDRARGGIDLDKAQAELPVSYTHLTLPTICSV